ncbi:MAG: hypothetical protein KAH23_04045 [Kiritimatiellae bacterium]|nr:hypothetical protein [Kiritimatiellia bacterium]
MAHGVCGNQDIHPTSEDPAPDATQIDSPTMLMIGSAGRNTGKTEFACAVIRRISSSIPVTGIKVTTIKQKNGTCPRGGKGCGVCSSLKGNYCITKETSRKSGKDTSRLLAAGAERVFWLRVMRSHLQEGFNALLELIGRNTISVCESNSLRAIVRPGLFLMIRDNLSDNIKESASAVIEYADRTIVSDGNDFDINPSQINVVSGCWILREKATDTGERKISTVFQHAQGKYIDIEK